MGKKSRAERIKAHQEFEQRLAARNANHSKEKEQVSPETVRAAIDFANASDPNRFQSAAMMKKGVLEKIARGHFTPSHNQMNKILSAAKSIGWTPS